MRAPVADAARLSSRPLRQATIIALLVAAMVFLARFRGAPTAGFDASALMAGGFIVLASYTIGQLVEVVRLPHITGYLLAGVLFGPSIAALLPTGWRVPPFDEGVLNHQVTGQLGLLNSLAIALIALTAGGELRLPALRRSLRTLLGLLGGQLVAIVLFVVALITVLLSSGGVLQLPGTTPLGLPAALALGAIVAAISFATSPAATIAIVNDTGARGSMTRSVMAAVVLKDVLVVILFSLAATAAGRLLGLAGGGSLWNEIGIHIGGSIAAGLALGALISLYLRYVRREVLLFLVAFVYTATYVAQRLHLDPVLLFLAAGFLVANFSREGETLIHSVEKLSLPVYVVFFTLAGASLHLDQFLQLAPFALALVLMRVLAMFLGCRLGAGLVRADESTRRYAWLGFVSQAGVALSLAQLVGQRFGGVGQALQTLIIAAIAVNELFGPILLKVALQLAGEIPKPQAADAPTPSSTSQPAASDAPTALSTWQQDARTADAWGAPVESVSAELREVLVELESDLQHIVRDFDAGALSALRQQGEAYLRELRREFLRHHRRVFAQLRSPEAGAQPKTWLRKEQAELTERWRGIVLARGTKLSQQDWTLDGLVQRIDQRVMNVPERLRAPFEPESYLPRQDGSWWAGLARARLRARRRLRRLWGMGEPMRAVDVRVLARFHLSGRVPAELEGLASLLVQADNHLAARTRSIFSGIVRRYDALIARRTRPPEVAPQQEEAPAELEAQLLQLRQDTEAELQLALCEVQSIATDAQWRATLPLSQAMQRIKHDALVLGTHALPRRKRRVSRLFRRRGAALHTLTHDLKAVRSSCAAGYARLAMELELMTFSARAGDLAQDYAREVRKQLRGKGSVHLERAQEAVLAAHSQMQTLLAAPESPTALIEGMRKVAGAAEGIIAQAAHSCQQLYTHVSDEAAVAALLNALGRHARALSERYAVTAGQIARGEWRLPPAIAVVEVPFADIVSAYVESEVAPQVLVQVRAIAAEVQPLAALLQESERRIAFNVELATGELEVLAAAAPVQDATLQVVRETALGVFERTHGLLETQQEQAQAWLTAAPKALVAAVEGPLSELGARLVDGTMSRAGVDALRRAALGQRLRQRAEALPARLHVARKHARMLLGLWLGEARVEAWRRSLGLPDATAAAGPLDFAPAAVAECIPLVYRRLFAADTLEAADVLTGRDVDITRARSLLSAAPKSRQPALALIGPDGVGKASVAHAIVRSGTWKELRRVDLRAPVEVAEVQRWFGRGVEGSLCMLDGFHWLLNGAEGFAPLHAFVAALGHSRGRQAWLLSADPLVWRYACQVAPLAAVVPQTLTLAPLGESELEAAVLARHSLSGLGLQFSASWAGLGERLWPRWLLRGLARMQRPHMAYFRALHQASGGLVRDALRLWLASIQQVDESADYVALGPVPPTAAAALRRLPESTLLQLYAIARQGWADAANFAAWLCCSKEEATAQLSALHHRALLETQSDCYRVSRHLRGPLNAVWRDMEWL